MGKLQGGYEAFKFKVVHIKDMELLKIKISQNTSNVMDAIPLCDTSVHIRSNKLTKDYWLTKVLKLSYFYADQMSKAVFLNRRAAARYRALASIIPGREGPEETTICYKISLVQLITNLNVILYLSTCNTVYISVLILFMIMP